MIAVSTRLEGSSLDFLASMGRLPRPSSELIVMIAPRRSPRAPSDRESRDWVRGVCDQSERCGGSGPHQLLVVSAVESFLAQRLTQPSHTSWSAPLVVATIILGLTLYRTVRASRGTARMPLYERFLVGQLKWFGIIAVTHLANVILISRTYPLDLPAPRERLLADRRARVQSEANRRSKR